MTKIRRQACSTKRVSPQQLWDMFHKKFDNDVCPHEFNCLGPKFQTDLAKVNFDFENFDFDNSEEELGSPSFLGSRKFWTRSPLTCFSFIGCYAGGDWEWPINFIIYLDKDGKTFRAYIPKEGNAWNYDTKQAFGNDYDADNKFLTKWINKWIAKNPTDLIMPKFEEHEYEPSDVEVMLDYEKIVHEMRFRFEGV
jgi:hypothetical protein